MKIKTSFLLMFLLMQFLILSGCSKVTTYNIDIAYAPQSILTGSVADTQKLVVTAALFNDDRGVGDLLSVGKRIKIRGEEVPVKAFVPPGLSVASTVKEYLFRAGHSVGGSIPAWDGSDHSMDENWGDIVIGGSIKELDITASTGFSMVDYIANVKLGIVVGDIRQGKILYTTTLDSSSSVKDVRFSQKKMAEVLNSVLSSVIESAFRDGRLSLLLQ